MRFVVFTTVRAEMITNYRRFGSTTSFLHSHDRQQCPPKRWQFWPLRYGDVSNRLHTEM